MFFSFFDLLLILLYSGVTILIIRKFWFYSLYAFTKFIFTFFLAFFLAKYAVFLKPGLLHLTNLQFFIVFWAIFFFILWKLVHFGNLFIFLNRKILNLDKYIYFHHLNTYLNYVPSFIVSFFITFSLFTFLLSFSSRSPFLQQTIASSLFVKEIPYKIYFASFSSTGPKLFDNILFNTTTAASSSAHVTTAQLPQEVISKQQEMINSQREQRGLPAIGGQVFYPEISSPQPTLFPTNTPTPSPFIPSQTPILSPTTTQIPQPLPSVTPTYSPTSTPIDTPTPIPEPTATPTPTPSPTPINLYDAEKQVYLLTNQKRVENNVEPLVWDDNIAAVARAHSIDMNNRNFFAHTNPDGITPFQRMKLGGISSNASAENIVGTQTPELMIEWWMNSPGHRKNILNPKYKRIGVGIAENNMYGLLGTQNFAD